MTRRLLMLWVSGYALAWTLVTVLLDPTVPYDAVEALNWAQNAEWGTPKNPWLVGVVMRPALWLPPDVYWYASHFLAIAIGMAGTWFLARQLSGSTRLAWLALLTLNLSGVINFDIICYNDNYLLVMLWPWMMLFYWLAIHRNAQWWMAFAITAGLAIMAKYSSLALVGFIFLSTLAIPSIRRCYREPAFYIALLIAFALIAPNALWLWNHDFAAFRWVDSQIKPGFNLQMFINLLSIFYPLLILAWILRRAGAGLQWPVEWARRVMLGVYLLPLLVICGWFLFHDGGRLTEWLQPFFILSPALMVCCVKRDPPRSLSPAIKGLIAFAVLVISGYVGVMTMNVANAGQKMRGIIPFSQQMERLWQERYETPLSYVGGEHMAQWLTFYTPSRPQIITRWDVATHPNIYNVHISRRQIERHGALLIGRVGVPCASETFKRALYDWPEMKIDDTQQIAFHEDPAYPARPLCIAFVSPVS